MTDIAIRVRDLTKKYQIVTGKTRHDTLREQITEAAKGIFGRNRQRAVPQTQSFLALKDVSLDIVQGEVLGIIGRNGAGKSTLLKVLSRITEPTSGRAEVYGRVASLLEVGTGFHGELSGRENVFLNGSILGMTRKTLERRFDQIVAFAEIDRFIDTPVKHYSSGMYVRLAFAVAAHLDPEILIVDEVLAVGDAKFQEKCLSAMQDSASSGKTVLFVSHNMASVQHLCTRAILLDGGQIVEDGLPRDVVKSYLAGLSDAHDSGDVFIRDWPDRMTNGQARIVQFQVGDANGALGLAVPVGGSVKFRITAEFREPVIDPCFGVIVHDQAGDPILDLRSIHDGLRFGRAAGTVVLECRVDNLGLYPGTYLLSPWITDAGVVVCVDWVKLCTKMQVFPAPGPHGDLKLDPKYGSYWVKSTWDTRVEGSGA
jgi:homopolymeric O-antigen transport system ATP-binding protein